MAIAVTTPRKQARQRVSEQFDLNTIKVAGTIIKLWGRSRDVFARLRVSLRRELRETDDTQSCYINLRIPDGMVQDSPVTLTSENVVRVTGYATHTSYYETLRKFLSEAGESSFFDNNVPADDLDAWRSIQFQRQNAIVNVTGLEIVQPDVDQGRKQKKKDASNEVVNFVDLEGIVAARWEYPRSGGVDLFVRIAVYDEHAPISEGKQGNFGHPIRIPHYINVLFPGGKTSQGNVINAQKKQRLRVRGEFRDRGRITTLHENLLAIGSTDVIDLMQKIKDPDTLKQITAQQESLHVLANAVVVYG